MAAGGAPRALVVALGLVQCAALAFMARDRPPGTSLTLTCLGGAWASYLIAASVVSRRAGASSWSLWTIVVGFALAFRVITFTGGATGAGDYHRYLFDGRALAAGLDIYAIRPRQHPRLGGDVVPLGHIETIYPPAAETLFLAAQGLGGTLESWRALTLLADLGSAALLFTLPAARRARVLAMLLYLWNPLVLKECIDSAHVDSWCMFGVLLFYWLLARRRRIWALPALAFASLVKLAPVVLLVPWLSTMRRTSTRLAYGCSFVVLCILGFAPFAPHTPLPALLHFFTSIEGKGILFNGLSPLMTPEHARLAVTLAGGTLLFHLVGFSRRYELEDDSPSFVATAELFLILFVFSTMGFPWYLTVLVPVASLRWKPRLEGFIAATHLVHYAAHGALVACGMLFGAVLLLWSVLVEKEWTA